MVNLKCLKIEKGNIHPLTLFDFDGLPYPG